MQREDAAEFEQILEQLLALDGRQLTKPVTLVWWRALEKYALADVRRAMDAFVRDPDAGRYPPKPAHIISHMEASEDAKALSAFDTLWDAIAKAGPWTAVSFEDPATMRIIQDLGGWPRICGTWEESDRPFRQQEFVVRWKGYQRTGTGELPPALPGSNTDGVVARIGSDRRVRRLERISGEQRKEIDFYLADD